MSIKRPALIFGYGSEARELRYRLTMKQDEFWGRIAVKQSAGSRYESESNPLPHQISCLLQIAYGTPAQAQQVVEWLRQAKTD